MNILIKVAIVVYIVKMNFNSVEYKVKNVKNARSMNY